jgi:antitoxin CptB
MNSNQNAKIIWNCRRGMLELDLILGRFIKYHLDELTDIQRSAFEALLTAQDPDLYAWLMGYEEPSDEVKDIVAFIKLHDKL